MSEWHGKYFHLVIENSKFITVIYELTQKEQRNRATKQQLIKTAEVELKANTKYNCCRKHPLAYAKRSSQKYLF